MTCTDVLEFARDRSIRTEQPFGRNYFWMMRRDFETIRHHFVSEFNLLQRGRSLRTRHWLFHVHAIEQGDVIFIHRDFGNPRRFLPLGIVHIVVDVVPSFLYCLLTWQRPKKLWEPLSR